MSNIQIVKGDITLACVDAVVNAANPMMLGGGGVDGAIHRAAGPGLLEACRRVKAIDGVRCPVGEARITSAGNLSAKYVIHTVGPRYGIDTDASRLLMSAYQNCLDLALEHQCRSIAFPAISCGAYGYPLEEAADIAVSVCQKKVYQGLEIYFYLYSKNIVDVWTGSLLGRAGAAGHD